MGQFAPAIALLDEGMDAYRATGSRLYLSGFLRMSAEAHGWAGRVAEATDLIGEAIAVMEATDQRWDEAEIHRVRGALLRAAGDDDAARSALEQARAVARRQGAGLWELRATCDLADLLIARGAPGDAGAMLGPVLAAFEADADIPDLARARALAARESARMRCRRAQARCASGARGRRERRCRRGDATATCGSEPGEPPAVCPGAPLAHQALLRSSHHVAAAEVARGRAASSGRSRAHSAGPLCCATTTSPRCCSATTSSRFRSAARSPV